MSPVLPSGPLLSAFLLASLVLAITPGPGVIYIVTRSAVHGRRSGLASVAGVALGNLGNAWGAALGLAALFALSALAFAVVKYAGALYLVYLGVQALHAPRGDERAAEPDAAPLGAIFRDGFVIALLNPKTALFFAAFLPQFVGDAPGAMQRSVSLGALFVAIAAVTDTGYALLAGAVAPALADNGAMRAAGRRVGGGALIGLGVLAALSGSRSAR